MKKHILSIEIKKDFMNDDFGMVWRVTGYINGQGILSDWSSEYPTSGLIQSVKSSLETYADGFNHPTHYPDNNPSTFKNNKWES